MYLAVWDNYKNKMFLINIKIPNIYKEIKSFAVKLFLHSFRIFFLKAKNAKLVLTDVQPHWD